MKMNSHTATFRKYLYHSATGRWYITFIRPSHWSITLMTQSVCQTLVERIPQKIKNRHFPKDSNHHFFSSFHYTRILSNGETVQRLWQIYSIKKAIFCFCCLLFGKDSSGNWNKTGCSGWKNLSRILALHYVNQLHRSFFSKVVRARSKIKIRKHLTLLNGIGRHLYN